MDLLCTQCAEPWDLDFVLHDAPSDFERHAACIYKCPCCEANEDLDGVQQEALRDFYLAFGDDVDAAAAASEEALMIIRPVSDGE